MRRSVVEHQEAVRELLRSAWAGDPDDGDTPVPPAEAVGRVLARDLVAPIDLPPFDNSQMDGYALRAPDEPHSSPRENQPKTGDFGISTPELVGYVVAETIPAGAVPRPLAPGEAAPIMTGAALPDGADAVVPVEAAHPPAFAAVGASVRLPVPETGAFVRRRGSDVTAGSAAMAAGTLLNPGHAGLASALGLDSLTVRRKKRVLLLTTGDEVVLPGEAAGRGALPPGKIFDANSALLQALLAQAGLDVVPAPVVADDPTALRALLDRRLQEREDPGQGSGGIDLVISTGGISAGAFEVVKQALSGHGGGDSGGGQMEFVGVALQPGGPQGLGTYRGVPVLCFPGNPVSAAMSVEMFLRPALTELTGAPAPRHRVLAALAHPLSSPAGKHQVRRAVYEGPGFESPATVREVGGPSSHLLGALAAANALIQVPAGVTELHAGAKVEVWLL